LTFRVVGYDEIHGRNDYISIDSPMARALLKKQEGRRGAGADAYRRGDLVLNRISYRP
jgi:transcription elongation factor GreB